jgi:hypothetical protein
MPASIYQNILAVNLAAGASVIVPHTLRNIRDHGDGVVPTVIMPDRSSTIIVVTADDTNVEFRNDGLDADAANFLCQFDHTIQQAVDGAPIQFWYKGGGVGGSGVEQAFRFTAAGGEGSDFVVAIPVAMPDDSYVVEATLAGVTAIFGLDAVDLLAGDRTTTQFRVITTAAVTAGDQIDFLLKNRA